MRYDIFKGTIGHGRGFLMALLMTLCLTAGFVTLDGMSVYADQTVIAKVKITHRAVSGQSLPAPDEKGHVVGIGQRMGEVDFDGRESATYESTAMVDGWIGKKGIYKGYSKYTFKDGSEIFFTWEAEGTRNKEGLPMQQGTGIIQKGTGRFEGIRGRAVFTTIQLKPQSEDPMRTSAADTVIVYTLP